MHYKWGVPVLRSDDWFLRYFRMKRKFKESGKCVTLSEPSLSWKKNF